MPKNIQLKGLKVRPESPSWDFNKQGQKYDINCNENIIDCNQILVHDQASYDHIDEMTINKWQLKMDKLLATLDANYRQDRDITIKALKKDFKQNQDRLSSTQKEILIENTEYIQKNIIDRPSKFKESGIKENYFKEREHNLNFICPQMPKVQYIKKRKEKYHLLQLSKNNKKQKKESSLQIKNELNSSSSSEEEIYDEEVFMNEISHSLKDIGKHQDNQEIFWSNHCYENCQINEQVNNKYDLHNHLINRHHIYPCQTCDFEFPNNQMRKVHRKNTDCKGQSYCEICKTKFKLKSDELYHKLKSKDSQCNLPCQLMNCKFVAADRIEYYHHMKMNHHIFQELPVKYKLLSELNQLIPLSPKLLQSLTEFNYIDSETLKFKTVGPKFNFNTDNALLIILDGEIIASLEFKIIAQQYLRAAFVQIPEKEGTDIKGLAISLQALSYHLRFQRLTEIICTLPESMIPLMTKLGFSPCTQEVKGNMPELFARDLQGKVLFSKKTPNSMANIIPKATCPESDIWYLPALDVERNKNLWGKLHLDDCLQRHIDKQPTDKQAKSLVCAQKSDQAITPDVIFQIIKNTIRIRKSQLWDPCKLEVDWAKQTHYDALNEDWHGDFVYCNPPFSLAAKFVSKSLREFRRGRNVLLLIPSDTARGSFGTKFLRQVAFVQHIGEVKFEPFKAFLPTPVSLVYILQPHVIQFVHNLRTKNLMADGQLSSRLPIQLRCKETKRYQQKEAAMWLIQQGCSLRKVKKSTKLQYNEVQQLAALVAEQKRNDQGV